MLAMAAGIEPDYGSNSLRWWTRSQRIRTFGEMPFEVALLEAEERPVSRRLGVDTRTVRKAMTWDIGL